MQKEVYAQSMCLINEVAYRYYIKKETMNQISNDLFISKSTISRLIKRAEEDGIIKFQMDPVSQECIHLKEAIREQYALMDVLVVPVDSIAESIELDEVKKSVALEGARYLQRIITDDDIIGLAWGGTMYHLIQYLNPCQRKGAKIVTLHGSIEDCDPRFEVETLVKRAAMAFGGKNISLRRNGLLTAEEMESLQRSDYYKQMQKLFTQIDITISGVGALYPEMTTPLATAHYLDPEERKDLSRQNAYCDLLLRFINKDGEECNTIMKDRTYSIDLDTYRNIPRKVIVASGSSKVHAINSLIKGGLVDVLIIDQLLAQALLALSLYHA